MQHLVCCCLQLAKARALARQKSAGRNQEWLAKQAEQLHALAQQTQQLSPAANLSTRSSLNKVSVQFIYSKKQCV